LTNSQRRTLGAKSPDARDLSAVELLQLYLEVSANEAEDSLQPRQLRRMTPFGEHQTGIECTDDITLFANFLPTIESVGVSAAAI
jgi:hypothetical protein